MSQQQQQQRTFHSVSLRRTPGESWGITIVSQRDIIRITNVKENSPTKGLLFVHDFILAINGYLSSDLVDARGVLASTNELEVVVSRQSKQQQQKNKSAGDDTTIDNEGGGAISMYTLQAMLGEPQRSYIWDHEGLSGDAEEERRREEHEENGGVSQNKKEELPLFTAKDDGFDDEFHDMMQTYLTKQSMIAIDTRPYISRSQAEAKESLEHASQLAVEEREALSRCGVLSLVGGPSSSSSSSFDKGGDEMPSSLHQHQQTQSTLSILKDQLSIPRNVWVSVGKEKTLTATERANKTALMCVHSQNQPRQMQQPSVAVGATGVGAARQQLQEQDHQHGGMIGEKRGRRLHDDDVEDRKETRSETAPSATAVGGRDVSSSTVQQNRLGVSSSLHGSSPWVPGGEADPQRASENLVNCSFKISEVRGKEEKAIGGAIKSNKKKRYNAPTGAGGGGGGSSVKNERKDAQQTPQESATAVPTSSSRLQTAVPKGDPFQQQQSVEQRPPSRFQLPQQPCPSNSPPQPSYLNLQPQQQQVVFDPSFMLATMAAGHEQKPPRQKRGGKKKKKQAHQ